MPFATHRGQRIHYESRGRGPTVVLQHGLFSRGSRWEDNGYVDALAADFRVVWVDSLGHGDSDKPSDPALYTLEQRALDLVAVFDAVEAERVHLVGYSMGGWMAAGVARHRPERLASLTIGGWDPIGGVRTEMGGAAAAGGDSAVCLDPPGVELILAGARARLPELVAWVTPDVEPALSACWRALFELDGAGQALGRLACPVLLWSGADDACHAATRALAEAHGFAFLSTRGDHAGAMVLEPERVLGGLRTLFLAGEARAASAG